MQALFSGFAGDLEGRFAQTGAASQDCRLRRAELEDMRLALTSIGLVAVLAGLTGCDGPWERSSSTQLASQQTTTHEIFADSGRFSKWLDKRAKSQITHGMLVIDCPKAQQAYFIPNSTVVITTTSDVIAEKAEAIARGDYRLPKGTRTNYAIGGTVDVRIERIVEGGKREFVGEDRVSFLEIVQP